MRSAVHALSFLFFFIGCSSSPDTTTPPGSDGGAETSTNDARADAPVACPALADVGDAGAGPSSPVYPDPKYASIGANVARAKTACVDTSALPSHDKLDALVSSVLSEAGLASAPLGDCSCEWTLAFGAEPTMETAAQTTLTNGKTSAERYAVVTSAGADRRAHTALFAASERGGLYALRAAIATATKSSDGVVVPAATIADYPDIQARGFIDGIYRAIGGGTGTFNGWPSAYTPATRAEILRLMARLRGNTFIYGPKCDPYGRGATCSGQGSTPNWTTAYPNKAGESSAIVTLAAEADRNLVDLYWALNPIVAVDWSQPTGAPLAAAKAKIDELRAMGVRHFAMFVDDASPTTPQNAASLMNATNAYLKSLDASDHLLVVTWAYNAEWSASTQQAFGGSLEKDIEVMWTGNAVEPCTLAAADMKGPNANYQRTLSIWDNWPSETTSCAGAYRKMIGRSADLPTAIRAYYSNPVLNEDGASLATELAQLGPIFDYTWTAARYDAAIDASYARWAKILPSWQAIDHPCSNTNCHDASNNVFYGFACSPTSPNEILFCDTYESDCVSTLRCPKGCAVQQNAMDTCN